MGACSGLSPPPHRLLPPVSGCEYGQGDPVVRRDVADSEGDVPGCAVADRSKVGVRILGGLVQLVLDVRTCSCKVWTMDAIVSPRFQRPHIGLRCGWGSFPTSGGNAGDVAMGTEYAIRRLDHKQ